MSIELVELLATPSRLTIEQAILETLAYSDVFEYPLRLDEIHRYLSICISREALEEGLDKSRGAIHCRDGRYFLAGREGLPALRRKREAISKPALRQAIRTGQMLGQLPFIRMAAITGSLALLNSEETADLDYMLVAARGRVWTARGFALLLGRITRITGHTLCPNLIVSEDALEWQQKDLYAAREICQMIPISGAGMYTRLRLANKWTETFLPNAKGAPALTPKSREPNRALQGVSEWLLQGRPGERLEAWEMNRKITRLRAQEGLGAETNFEADICQGNFHHHGARTRAAWQRRMMQLRPDRPHDAHPTSSEARLK